MAEAACKPFKLRKVLQTSQMDVRSVAAYPNGGFVCGSRDKISKLFASDKTGNGFTEAQNFTGPQHYVSSVAVMTTNNEHIVYVGSNDACIYSYDLKSSQPNSILIGHSGTVCSLYGDSENQLLMSGSWDQNAHIWRGNVTDKCLKGHQAAVWAVCSFGEVFLTGSADKTIKRWDKEGKDVQTYEGHSDCVRGLAFLDKDNFLSCSNDSTIRQWSIISGVTVKIFNGHDNYIYDLSVLKSTSTCLEFVTCSEDRTIRFWLANGETFQTIRLPAPTAWSVAALGEENVAVACSDGRVYTFTREDSRVASDEEIKSFQFNSCNIQLDQSLVNFLNQAINLDQFVMCKHSEENNAQSARWTKEDTDDPEDMFLVENKEGKTVFIFVKDNIIHEKDCVNGDVWVNHDLSVISNASFPEAETEGREMRLSFESRVLSKKEARYKFENKKVADRFRKQYVQPALLERASQSSPVKRRFECLKCGFSDLVGQSFEENTSCPQCSSIFTFFTCDS